MTSVPCHPSCPVSQTDRLIIQIGAARQLALSGNAGPARKICGSVFLDHAMLLKRDEVLLKAFIECLLLLEMTALLPRVFQAIYGIVLTMTPLTGSGVWQWRLTLGDHSTVALPSFGPRLDREMREEAAGRCSSMMMHTAAQDPVGTITCVTARASDRFTFHELIS